MRPLGLQGRIARGRVCNRCQAYPLRSRTNFFFFPERRACSFVSPLEVVEPELTECILLITDTVPEDFPYKSEVDRVFDEIKPLPGFGSMPLLRFIPGVDPDGFK